MGFLKKGNIMAISLMIVVLLSTIFIYFAENSNIFISSEDLFNPVYEQNIIYNSINDGFWNSFAEVMKDGYAQDSHSWFENGAYPPTIDEYRAYLNIAINEALLEVFSKFDNVLYNSLDTSNFILEETFDETNGILLYKLKNIYLIRDETNFYVKDGLEFEFDFSNQLKIFQEYKKWNSNEGIDLFNDILDSFQAICRLNCGCSLGSLSNLPSTQTGLDKDTIYSIIENKISILNSFYFRDSDIYCDYKILKEVIDNNYDSKVENGGVDSYCTDSQSLNVNSFDNSIWGHSGGLVEDTVIDGSTYSYNNYPRNNYIQRNLDDPMGKLISTVGVGIPFSLDGYEVGSGAYQLSEKFEPGVALKIDISCYDKSKFYVDDGSSFPLQSVFGYRINIFKGCNLPSTLIDYDGTCSQPRNCASYSCGIGGVSCVLDSSDLPSCSTSCGGGDVCDQSCSECSEDDLDCVPVCVPLEYTVTFKVPHCGGVLSPSCEDASSCGGLCPYLNSDSGGGDDTGDSGGDVSEPGDEPPVDGGVIDTGDNGEDSGSGGGSDSGSDSGGNSQGGGDGGGESVYVYTPRYTGSPTIPSITPSFIK